MIIYNNRFRGPFEYDKFALNILSFHNFVNYIEDYEINNKKSDFNSLKNIYKEVNNFYNKICCSDSLNDKIYRLIIQRGLILWLKKWIAASLMIY